MKYNDLAPSANVVRALHSPMRSLFVPVSAAVVIAIVVVFAAILFGRQVRAGGNTAGSG